jgi:hypothetical protein
MNRELKNKIFKIPDDILDRIRTTVARLAGKNTHGINRATKLLNDKNVKYGQLKRIIFDINSLDKVKDRVKYDLCGGELMERWAYNFLQGERDLVKNRKESQKRSNEITDLSGERKNGFQKKHTKKMEFSIPTNLIKSNSYRSSITPLKTTKLFEELDKIKKLISY